MQEIVQSIDRALCIIEVLSDYENGLGISEISEKVALHKSTVHRLLNTLIYKGYIKQNPSNSKYSLTLKLFELGYKKLAGMDLVTVARPYLNELMKEINEVVHLVIRDGFEIVYVAKVEPQKSITMYSRIGMRKPLYCTAVGKAMMSYMSESEINEIWNKSDITKLTEKTIVSYSQLKENLTEIREKGFALDDQEVETGIRCVASVIKDHSNSVCAAISISSSIFTFTEEKIDYYAKLIMEYADKISAELGYKKQRK